jgi:hypothetical protein
MIREIQYRPKHVRNKYFSTEPWIFVTNHGKEFLMLYTNHAEGKRIMQQLKKKIKNIEKHPTYISFKLKK